MHSVVALASWLAFEHASSEWAMALTQARAALGVSHMGWALDDSKVDAAHEASDECSNLRRLYTVHFTYVAH